MLGGIAAGPWFGHVGLAEQKGAYPIYPIHCILPYPIGGTSDLVARLVVARLGVVLGQPVVIEARPGAAGRIALDYVANAAPDGYTLLLANNGSNAVVPALQRANAIRPDLTFAPVTMLVRLPIVVAVTPALGMHKLADLIAQARDAPGRLSYASSGIGSTSHLAADLLFRRARVRLVHVAYPGTSAAVRDVLSGEVPVLFTHLGTVAALIRAGELRGLAVTGDHRMAEFPDLETVAEAGYPGFEVTTWHGVLAPAGTPNAIVMRLHDELVRILAVAEVRAQLRALGTEPVGDTPEQFASALDADRRRWAEIIRADAALGQ